MASVKKEFKDKKKIHRGSFFGKEDKVEYSCIVIAYLESENAVVEVWPTDQIKKNLYEKTMIDTSMDFPFTCIAKILKNRFDLENAFIDDDSVDGFFIFEKEVLNKGIL